MVENKKVNLSRQQQMKISDFSIVAICYSTLTILPKLIRSMHNISEIILLFTIHDLLLTFRIYAQNVIFDKSGRNGRFGTGKTGQSNVRVNNQFSIFGS